MKFKLTVSQEKWKEVEQFLEEHGIELDEEAEYIITEKTEHLEFLLVRDQNKEAVSIKTEDVIFIEAYGREIEIHTLQETYTSAERMYQLEEHLDRREFLRISKSVIIARKHVKKIRPSLSLKYVLTMTDGTLLDVTRSYYSEFRRFFDI